MAACQDVSSCVPDALACFGVAESPQEQKSEEHAQARKASGLFADASDVAAAASPVVVPSAASPEPKRRPTPIAVQADEAAVQELETHHSSAGIFGQMPIFRMPVFTFSSMHYVFRVLPDGPPAVPAKAANSDRPAVAAV